MTLRLLAAFALTHVIFATWPDIDPWVSALFVSEGRFPLVDDPAMEAARHAIWDAAIVVALAMFAIWPLSLAAGSARRVPARLWAWASGVFLLGPGLVVNVLLKAHWGRARPADVLRGEAEFTPPFEIAGECARNCSFVSGEAAGASALAIVVGTLLWPLLARRWRLPVILVLAATAAAAAGMRVMTGRHYLSDVLFAGFIVSFVALGLWRALRLDLARDAPRPAALAHDLGLLGARAARLVRRRSG